MPLIWIARVKASKVPGCVHDGICSTCRTGTSTRANEIRAVAHLCVQWIAPNAARPMNVSFGSFATDCTDAARSMTSATLPEADLIQPGRFGRDGPNPENAHFPFRHCHCVTEVHARVRAPWHGRCCEGAARAVECGASPCLTVPADDPILPARVTALLPARVTAFASRQARPDLLGQ
jgi:hypothetical protein